MCLPLLILCAIKSRGSLLAQAHPGGVVLVCNMDAKATENRDEMYTDIESDECRDARSSLSLS